MKTKTKYTKLDYIDALDFGLNYPAQGFDYLYYDDQKDLFYVLVRDNGLYNTSLQGFFVRSCLKWKGHKQWTRD